MSRHVATGLLILLFAAPAAAQAPDDVQRIEKAVVALAIAKRAAAGQVAENRRAAVKALAACKSSGPGWSKIRSVGVAAQRRLYARGARTLWKELGDLATEGAAFEAYRPGFERFLSRLESPFSDPLLAAGAEAWRQRIKLYAAYTPLGTCRIFNRLARRARQFPESFRADYLAGDVYNRMTRFVDTAKRKAARSHWGSRYSSALEAARGQLVALGGDEGYAAFFAFGHSLRSP
ncbi:MAG TPA: hypothetical protein VES62_11045 [Thermoleophilaceae bacterium]|nr:hypothetical protein [Actinomycetota bacterium]HYN51451.1 hypothetical protein [Thermoleophilaceae bacterium]